jgi:putative alpha-1,2-mannosidase
LNGQPWRKVWLRHADIIHGGTLELEMGNTPNEELGTSPADFPPSAINLDPMILETSRQ